MRRDFEQEESRRSESLYQELKAGVDAPLGEFIPLYVEAIITDAKKRRAVQQG